MEISGIVLSSLEELSSHDLVTVTIPEVLGSLKSYTFPLLSPELSSALVLLTLENSIGGGTTRTNIICHYRHRCHNSHHCHKHYSRNPFLKSHCTYTSCDFSIICQKTYFHIQNLLFILWLSKKRKEIFLMKEKMRILVVEPDTLCKGD